MVDNEQVTSLQVKDNDEKLKDLDIAFRKLIKIRKYGANGLVSGSKITTSTDSENELIWIVDLDYENDEFNIRLASNPKLALTASSTENITLENFEESNKDQKWHLTNAFGEKRLQNDNDVILEGNINIEEEEGIKIEDKTKKTFFSVISNDEVDRQEVETKSETGSKWIMNNVNEEFFTLTLLNDPKMALTLSNDDKLVVKKVLGN